MGVVAAWNFVFLQLGFLGIDGGRLIEMLGLALSLRFVVGDVGSLYMKFHERAIISYPTMPQALSFSLSLSPLFILYFIYTHKPLTPPGPQTMEARMPRSPPSLRLARGSCDDFLSELGQGAYGADVVAVPDCE